MIIRVEGEQLKEEKTTTAACEEDLIKETAVTPKYDTERYCVVQELGRT